MAKRFVIGKKSVIYRLIHHVCNKKLKIWLKKIIPYNQTRLF